MIYAVVDVSDHEIFDKNVAKRVYGKYQNEKWTFLDSEVNERKETLNIFFVLFMLFTQTSIAKQQWRQLRRQ